MGAFNRWAKGSFLEDPAQRTAVQVARNLMEGAAVVTRATQLRAAGAPVPSSLQGTPELLAFLDDGCGGLLEQLHAEWYEGDSLKAPYAQKRGK